MRSFTKHLLLFFFLAFAFLQSKAQSIMQPSDPLVTWDSTAAPPAQPAWGQIGKWVRAPKVPWNTVNFKSYIYKGTPFRLHFPKTYNPSVNDGKKYPLMVFFHGLGEREPVIYRNEFHLLLGHYFFDESINNGTYDGYTLSISNDGGFGPTEFDKIKEIIDYMIVNNKVDPFSLVINGLSSGGQGTWELLIRHPTYFAGAIPMSWTSIMYKDPAIMNTIRSTPIWLSHGRLDGNPAPYTVYDVKSAYNSVGANFRHTEYPYADHGTWNEMWAEPDFWGFLKRAYSSNPWPLYNKTQFFPGEAISSTLSLTPGFQAYEWRKDGIVIPGATSNLYTATALGTYDARVQRNGTWSDWSRVPVQLKMVSYTTLPAKIEAENWMYMEAVNKEGTSDAGGGENVGWIDYHDFMDYAVNVPAAGSYTVKLRVSSPKDSSIAQIRKPDGTVLATINIPNTQGWQTWTTVSAQVTLPAGYQVLRLYASGPGQWNVNWLEFSNGTTTPTNAAPTANAGADKTITLPTNSTQLSGSGADTDGSITAYAWTQVSGPSTATIGTSNAAATTVSNLVQGTYTFRLTVTDNAGATGYDEVVVTVNGTTTPPPPTGGSSRIEAENYTSMSGIQTEGTSDVGGGLNVGYIDANDWMDYTVNVPSAGNYTMNFRLASQWSGGQFQVKRGTTVLATVNAPNTGGWQTWQTVSATVNLVAGTQTIRLQSMNSSSWNINWLEVVGGGTTPTNAAPTANAGADKTITLPTNSTQLAGTGTDSDGSISAYAWSQVSGPNTASISAASSATTTVGNLVQGTYTFRLTVTDNGGATGTDDVVVTVNGSTTQPPPSGTSTKIEAENYSNMSGVQKETTSDVGGGQNVGYIDTNDWMEYVINPSTSGTYTIRFRLASQWSGGQFQVKRGTTVLATVNTPNTGGWQTWTTISTTVTLSAGTQTIRLQSMNSSSWNINWLELVQGNALMAAPTTAPETTMARAAIGTDPVAFSTAGSGKEIGIYPNPVQGQFTLELDNDYTGAVRVQILDMNGSVVKEQVMQKMNRQFRTSLSAAGIPKGQYMLVTQMGNRRGVQRLMKQ